MFIRTDFSRITTFFWRPFTVTLRITSEARSDQQIAPVALREGHGTAEFFKITAPDFERCKPETVESSRIQNL